MDSNQTLLSVTSSNAMNSQSSCEDHDIEDARPSQAVTESQIHNELQMIRWEIGELQAMLRTPVPPYSDDGPGM